jgi:hypothetical protein
MSVKDKIPSAESIMESLPLPRDFLARLGVISAQVTRKLTIDQVEIDSGDLGDVSIDKVTLGSASVGSINITNTAATLHNSSAVLNNVRAIVALHFRLNWEIDLGWIFKKSGSEDMGTLDIPVDLGDIDIPDLDNIDLAIPAVNIPATAMAMLPVTNLDLGKFSLNQAQVDKLGLPSAGLSLTGLGVGNVTLSSLNVPAANAQSLAVVSAAPEKNILLPGASLDNLTIPTTSIPQILSGNIQTAATSSAQSIGVNLGFLDISIAVTPTVHLNIEDMTLSDVELSATIGQVKVNDIDLAVAVQGIKATGMNLNGVNVSSVKF